jgi:hypothetical protein
MSNKTEDGALGADLEYEDNDSTGVIRFNHHPMQGLVGSVNYTQRVHRNLMLGFDFTHLVQHFLYSFLIKNNCLAMVVNCSLEITYCMHLQFKVEHNTMLAISFQFIKELLLFLTIKLKQKMARQPLSE